MGGENKRVVGFGGVLLLVGFCCFLLIEVSTVTPESELELVIPGVSVSKEAVVFNYVSKRRVPNGPDPIHNRKIGIARETPERA
ncbi:hypothetical protein LXL04_006197 [Taraxacum kok-saghyz]